jgi:hypothetical protein
MHNLCQVIIPWHLIREWKFIKKTLKTSQIVSFPSNIFGFEIFSTICTIPNYFLWLFKTTSWLFLTLSTIHTIHLTTEFSFYQLPFKKLMELLDIVSNNLLGLQCVRLRAFPPFRGLSFPGVRGERRDCQQHIKKRNIRPLFALVKLAN